MQLARWPMYPRDSTVLSRQSLPMISSAAVASVDVGPVTVSVRRMYRTVIHGFCIVTHCWKRACCVVVALCPTRRSFHQACPHVLRVSRILMSWTTSPSQNGGWIRLSQPGSRPNRRNRNQHHNRRRLRFRVSDHRHRELFRVPRMYVPCRYRLASPAGVVRMDCTRRTGSGWDRSIPTFPPVPMSGIVVAFPLVLSAGSPIALFRPIPLSRCPVREQPRTPGYADGRISSNTARFSWTARLST